MTATPATFVTGVDFVTVPAQDFEASVHFYGTVLGLPHVKNWGDMPAAEFQAGNLTLAVMEPTEFGHEFRPHGLPIALQVDDVAAARAHLEARGVRLSPTQSTAASATRRSSSTRPATRWTSTTATRRTRSDRARRNASQSVFAAMFVGFW